MAALTIIQYFLYPFSVMYGWIIQLRNWLYDTKLKESTGFSMPVIGVGNLSSGGTGKTPMAEFIIELLVNQNLKPALLSRGYKRKTKGFVLVKPHSSARHVGDEPYQIKKKFPDVMVAVCEDRVQGIDQIRRIDAEIDAIVLDDSYQHRKLQTGLNILLTDYNKPFYDDMMLPAGNLREGSEGKKRADIIIMTKCPEYPSENERKILLNKIQPSANQHVFFTSLGYNSMVRATEDENELEHEYHSVEMLAGYSAVVFTGIAYPEPMLHFLENICQKVTHIRFADHHNFTDKDVQKIQTVWNTVPEKNKLLLTTEKDWRRLEHTPQAEKLAALPLYFLPIVAKFNDAEKRSFEQKLMNYVSKNKRSN